METTSQKLSKVFTVLKEARGYKNPMQSPRLVKLVVSSGVGSIKDKKKIELVAERLATITGQKPGSRGAKKAIASYKTRVGDVVGYQVTLRGTRMLGFMDKLLNVALPRTKDFHGFPKSSVDSQGNMSIGIKEHTIFPETPDEELKDIFGISITIVTSAKGKDEAIAFLAHLGVPFRK